MKLIKKLLMNRGLVFFTCSLLASFSMGGEPHLNDISEMILADIKRSQEQLMQIQDSILIEKTAVDDEVAGLESAVIKLQVELDQAEKNNQQDVLRSAEIEKEISNLQRDLNGVAKSVSELISDIALPVYAGDRNWMASDHLSNGEVSGFFELYKVSAVIERLKNNLAPVFTEGALADEAGLIKNASILHFGPNHYFISENLKVGLARQNDAVLQQHQLFFAEQRQSLINIKENGAGFITFDPTLGQLELIENSQEGPVEHVQKGGLWVLPILLFGLLALMVAILKSFQLFRLPAVKPFHVQDVQQLRSNVLVFKAGMGDLQRSLFDAAMAESKKQNRDDKLFMLLDQAKHLLEKWISLIAITAAIAPLLGLLGTVSGMIETFKMMTLFGSGDAEVVSGGIAQALITTELGLLVAIPALILNAVLSRKANRYYQELENFALLLASENASDEQLLNKVAAQ